MTLAMIGNEILGGVLFIVVLALLGGAIRRSPADHVIANAASRRRRAREARRATTGTPHPRAAWTARPDAS